MAARQTVPQSVCTRKSALILRSGVATLCGYGIQVRVERGHLILQDGIGPERREGRFARVGHGLKRLVLIGPDGLVSLAALRWLADQGASFVMLERDGAVLATTGPARASDARLRRAQALAQQSGVALQIARELVSRKLAAQEKVARHDLNDLTAAGEIARLTDGIGQAQSIDALRLIESRAARTYWDVWRNVPIEFPRKDLLRVPDHWRVFGARVSPLTGSPRLAANPPNAMLNYLYALLEAECRIAAAALGLDPGVGVMHADAPYRDSLACDVMEPVRPHVDSYVLDWLRRGPLRREWFFEQRDGNCRLMSELAARLSECAPTLARAVAPVAEQVASALWRAVRKAPSSKPFPTRLTQLRKREVKGGTFDPAQNRMRSRENLCHECGAVTWRNSTRCAACESKFRRHRLIKAAKTGRIASSSPIAQRRRSETQRRQHAARAQWNPSELPAWLTLEFFRREVQPALKRLAPSALARSLGVSVPYAADIRKEQVVPHPRHWQTLADLVGASRTDKEFLAGSS